MENFSLLLVGIHHLMKLLLTCKISSFLVKGNRPSNVHKQVNCEALLLFLHHSLVRRCTGTKFKAQVYHEAEKLACIVALSNNSGGFEGNLGLDSIAIVILMHYWYLEMVKYVLIMTSWAPKESSNWRGA